MTTLGTGGVAQDELDGPSGDGGEISGAATVARALPVMTARLRARHPEVPPEIVERHVHVAAAGLLRGARIHNYLPILIERKASASLGRGPVAPGRADRPGVDLRTPDPSA